MHAIGAMAAFAAQQSLLSADMKNACPAKQLHHNSFSQLNIACMIHATSVAQEAHRFGTDTKMHSQLRIGLEVIDLAF